MGRGLFERGGLFYLVNVVVSVLHKELVRIRSGNAQVQEVGDHVAKTQI